MSKRRTAAFGDGERDGDDGFAVGELLRQPLGIITMSVRRDDADLVATRQLGDRVQAADAAAGGRGPEAPHLHPQDSHTAPVGDQYRCRYKLLFSGEMRA